MLVDKKIVDEASGSRGYIALQDIPPNTLIMECDPFLTVVTFEYRKNVCFNCFKLREEKPFQLKCQKCYQIYFCSDDCMSLKYHAHEKICQDLCKLKKILLRNKHQGQLTAKDIEYLHLILQYLHSETKNQDFQDLYSCQPLFESSNNKSNQEFKKLYNEMQLLLSSIGHKQNVADFIYRERCNAFGIWKPEEESNVLLGYGVYPLASYFNHSCLPNVQRSTNFNRIQFYSKELIRKGQECFISYGSSLTSSITETRELLLQNYHFLCNCKRCKE